MHTLIARRGRGRTADRPDKDGPPGRTVGPGIAMLGGVASDAVSGRASQIRARDRNCRERSLQKTQLIRAEAVKTVQKESRA
jgi:hypothetical protein